VADMTTIVGEKHARKVVDRVVEDLAVARQWVWEHMHAWLPSDGNAPPQTRHEVEAYGAYSAWWTKLDTAIRVLDEGAADMLTPKTEDERQAMLKRIQEAREARLSKDAQR
jgi:hypothetical protein